MGSIVSKLADEIALHGSYEAYRAFQNTQSKNLIPKMRIPLPPPPPVPQHSNSERPIGIVSQEIGIGGILRTIIHCENGADIEVLTLARINGLDARMVFTMEVHHLSAIEREEKKGNIKLLSIRQVEAIQLYYWYCLRPNGYKSRSTKVGQMNEFQVIDFLKSQINS